MPALSSLTQWSQEHIQRIFESKSDADAISAIDQTFATSLKGSINGKDLTYDGVGQLVRAVRNCSPTRSLKVEWHTAIETSADSENLVSVME